MKLLSAATIGLLLLTATPAQADSQSQREVIDNPYPKIVAVTCLSHDPATNEARWIEAQGKDGRDVCPDGSVAHEIMDYGIESITGYPDPLPASPALPDQTRP